MTRTFYITTPIYYVNDRPHIGHAYTSVACDVMARYKRLQGCDVRFLTGTDEHGLKVEQSAKRGGIAPQAFTDEVSGRFRELSTLLNLSNNDFIRTTEARHKEAVQKFWKKIEKNKHITLGAYKGWYSVRDEAYYAESELTKDGEGNRIAPSGSPVEWVEEPSYFFDLSKWQDKLLHFYEKHPDFVYPQSRYNEVKSFVRGGLEDLSISRTSFDWGVHVPGDDTHVMYVWLDALYNYVSALGGPEGEDYNLYWPADIHMVGKDILRFHAVYWPAFLMAADMPVPKRIVAHGWWTNEGQKISKSVGNVIDPHDLVATYGLDPVRYFLLREVPFGNDGDFAPDKLVARVNSELANNIGNLAQRSLSMIHKNCDAKVPGYEQWFEEEVFNLREVLEDKVFGRGSFTSEGRLKYQDTVGVMMSECQFDRVLEFIITSATNSNTFFNDSAPWSKKGADQAGERNTILYVTIEAVRMLAILLQPFIPDSAGKLLNQLAVHPDQRTFAHLSLEYALKPGTLLPKPEGVFPRLEA